MNLNDVKQSKFLKKEDVGNGKLATISALTQENVAVEGAEPEMRITVHFNQLEKPMVLNSTNAQIIARITGHTEDIEHNWVGTTVVLYNDPNVSYAGKLVGGIRVRAPKPGTVKPKPATVAAPGAIETFSDGSPVPENDGLPF